MISVIIPAFNEQETLPQLIAYLNTHAGTKVGEILVVDGGSTDNTVKACEKAGAKVLKSPERGRARQMNYGAKHAKGDVFYFLHADTFPPASYGADICQAIAQQYGAGCYRLTFNLPHPLLKFYAWFTRFNIDLFRFGDQSLFVEKKVFWQVGGFDESLLVMEDQLIVRQLKKHTTFKLLKKTVTTSARKYKQVGVVRLQLIFTAVLLMFYMGVEQRRIVNFYFSKIK